MAHAAGTGRPWSLAFKMVAAARFPPADAPPMTISSERSSWSSRWYAATQSSTVVGKGWSGGMR